MHNHLHNNSLQSFQLQSATELCSQLNAYTAGTYSEKTPLATEKPDICYIERGFTKLTVLARHGAYIRHSCSQSHIIPLYYYISVL